MSDRVGLAHLLALSDTEKVARFDAMVRETFSHLNGRDLLRELHPRKTLDIKRRVDGVETWFEADWLSDLMRARDTASNAPLPLACTESRHDR